MPTKPKPKRTTTDRPLAALKRTAALKLLKGRGEVRDSGGRPIPMPMPAKFVRDEPPRLIGSTRRLALSGAVWCPVWRRSTSLKP